MVEEGTAPDAPQQVPPPAQSLPPQGMPPGYAPYPPYPPYQPQPQPAPRKSRWWVWLLVISLLFLCIIASCAPLALMMTGPNSTGSTFGGITNGAVAVIPIDGTIQGLGGSGTVTPAGFLRQLNQAERDPRVKAIVLRVDSGGGTVAASEEISTYVKNASKPVVVSVGDICASGAYMISSQSDKIYAIEGSSVGSIGVILQIPNVQELLDKLGISVATITAGENKDVGSPYRDLTKEERERLQGQVDEVYEQFIRIVAEGRKLPVEDVRELATGWVWTGTEAKKLKLIDEIGTYQDAVNGAAELGGIEGEPQIITYEEPFADLFGQLGGLAAELNPYANTVPADPVPK